MHVVEDAQLVADGGVDLIDVTGFRRILARRKNEFVVALITAVTVCAVGVEQGIDLPGLSGGPVVVPAGRLPLDASVTRVLPLSGRLWVMVGVRSGGWRKAP